MHQTHDRIASVNVDYHFPDEVSEGGGAGSRRNITLKDICYKPFADQRCLVHSPLEYWLSNETTLLADLEIRQTLSNKDRQSSYGTPIPLHSVLGGVSYDDGRSGGKQRDVSGSLLGAESIVITYFLEDKGGSGDGDTPQDWTSEVWDRIWAAVILPGPSDSTTSSSPSTHPYEVAWRSVGEVKHLYYDFNSPQDSISADFMILVVSYLIVFLYISLILGRVELVKSKFGLGLAAVVMVFCSLLMAVGLSSVMGVTTSLVPWEVLPFLIIAIGVENILVLTNAVVTTSLDLPVKERVGLGLSKVGWKMSISVAGELSFLLTVSMIDIPALQEFCLFACVSVVMDFFMQITFFTTILSIDIRRLELSDLHKLSRMKKVVAASKTDEGMVDSDFESQVRQRRHLGATIIIGLVIILGLGLIGSSTTAAVNTWELDSEPANSTLWVNSMSVTADVLWDVINPSKSDRYVEIRPPVYLTVVNPGDPAPDSSNQNTSVSNSNDGRKTWKVTIDTFTVELSPVMFTGLIVSVLLILSLSCVLLTSIIYTRSSKPHSSSDSGRVMESNQGKRRNSGTRTLNCVVMSFTGSNFRDVEFVDISDHGVISWACDEYLYIYHAATARKFRVKDGCIRKSDEVTCLQIVSCVESMVVVGTLLGIVRVWLAETGSWVADLQGDKSPSLAITQIASCRSKRQWLHLTLELFLVIYGWGWTSTVQSQVFAGTTDGVVRSFDAEVEGDIFSRMHLSEVCCMSSDRDGRILVTGSTTGEILVWDVASKKELLLIGSKQQSLSRRGSVDNGDLNRPLGSLMRRDSFSNVRNSARFQRTSFESTSTSSSHASTTTATATAFTKSERLAPVWEGHAGEITFLHIYERDSMDPATIVTDTYTDGTPVNPPDTISPTRIIMVSAGKDEVVKVWEMVLQRSEHQVRKRGVPFWNLVSARIVRAVLQPGCITVSAIDSWVFGVSRAVSEYNGSSVGNEAIRGSESAGSWSLWMLNLNESFSTIQTVIIGQDELRGFTPLASKLPMSRSGRRDSTFDPLRGCLPSNTIDGRIIPEPPKDISEAEGDWVDDDAATSDNGGSDDDDKSDDYQSDNEEGASDDAYEADVLPVLSIRVIKASKWGVVCGFGNYSKVILFNDLFKSEWNTTGPPWGMGGRGSMALPPDLRRRTNAI
ncbi:hypothetical protein HDU76_007060 [Blyttiomyces sp. JEL0837]|nr:hypothetical protein HDU76_007060 [Blyttiomyces sp. JEL0837]